MAQERSPGDVLLDVAFCACYGFVFCSFFGGEQPGLTSALAYSETHMVVSTRAPCSVR
jgi:hypothetical protein